MISKFKKEEDILNYLMTSEFLDEELNPDEMRELLLKFRYFYRSSHAKQESMTHTIDKLENRIDVLEKENVSMDTDLKKTSKYYEEVFERELTFKERLKGKIYKGEYDRRFHLFKK